MWFGPWFRDVLANWRALRGKSFEFRILSFDFRGLLHRCLCPRAYLIASWAAFMASSNFLRSSGVQREISQRNRSRMAAGAWPATAAR